jgi:hypothetical protein
MIISAAMCTLHSTNALSTVTSSSIQLPRRGVLLSVASGAACRSFCLDSGSLCGGRWSGSGAEVERAERGRGVGDCVRCVNRGDVV